jgi:hypothetical protein
MGSTIVSSGERIADNNLQEIFVHGAYNLGPVYTVKELATTAAHPGEGVTYPTGAGGEDSWLIFPDASPNNIAILEIDFLQMESCATDYAVGDEAKAIKFHMNPGALLRNIQCVDQVGDVANAGGYLTTISGEPGAYKYLTETALASSATGTTESFAAATTISTMASIHGTRTPLRQAYYEVDTSGAYTCVAYILNV